MNLNNIKVEPWSEGGFHLTVPDKDTQNKLADAIRSGNSQVILGAGKERCAIDFGDYKTSEKTDRPGTYQS